MIADVVEVDRAGCGVLEEQAVDDGLRRRRGNGTILVHANPADSILGAQSGALVG